MQSRGHAECQATKHTLAQEQMPVGSQDRVLPSEGCSEQIPFYVMGKNSESLESWLTMKSCVISMFKKSLFKSPFKTLDLYNHEHLYPRSFHELVRITIRGVEMVRRGSVQTLNMFPYHVPLRLVQGTLGSQEVLCHRLFEHFLSGKSGNVSYRKGRDVSVSTNTMILCAGPSDVNYFITL